MRVAASVWEPLVVLAQEILTGLDVGGGFTALSRIQTGV